MKFQKIVWLILLLSISHLAAVAQILQPARWSYDVTRNEAKVNEEVELVFNVTIHPDWYLYSSDFDPDLGPTVTTFTFQKHPSYALVGKIIPINPKKKFDKVFGGEYTYFTKTAQFRQKIKILSPDLTIKGSYEYQVCTDKDGKCIAFDDNFVFDQIKVNGVAAVTPPGPVEQVATATTTPSPATNLEENGVLADDPVFQNIIAEVDAARADSAQKAGALASTNLKPDSASTTLTAPTYAGANVADNNPDLLGFMLVAFLTGLLALLTPCVFPMN